MNAPLTSDQQTYKRAATAAMVGLAAQIALALIVLVGAIAFQSPGLTAAAWHFFGGVPIWIVLLLLYNQHRQERIEALEAEQLAQTDVEAAAIFDEHAEELQLSRRRLDRLYKWGLNLVGLLVSLYLLVAGVTLYLTYSGAGQQGLWADRIVGERLMTSGGAGRGALAIVGIAVTLVVFLIARYLAGMTKIKQWRLLRGGASYLMGNALVSLMVTLAAGWLAIKDSPVLFEYLALVIPAVLVLIGAEIVLTFMMNLYRPRRPGEIPRPAFDSRLLGFLTSPESLGRIITETINYQFGFEISRSWFYRLLAKAVTPLIVFGALALFALSSVVIVEPHQQAIFTRLGVRVSVEKPGVHFKLPWPMAGVEKYAVDRVHQISVGSVYKPLKKDVAILWTNQHAADDERLLLTAGGGHQPHETPADQKDAPSLSLTAAEVSVQFRVRDLEKFVTAVPDPRQLELAAQQSDVFAERDPPGPYENERIIDPCPLLTALADRCVAEYFANNDLDDLLYNSRRNAGEQIRQKIQAIVDDPLLALGVEIVHVGLTQVHPPQNQTDESTPAVAAKFHEQIAAFQEKESAIQLANKEAAEILSTVAGSQDLADRIFAAIEQADRLKQSGADENELKQSALEVKTLLETQAGGSAAQLIHQAWAYRWTRAIGRLGEAQRFRAELSAYERAPDYYRQRAYLKAMTDYLPRTRKYLYVHQPPPGAMDVIELELRDTDTGVEDILGE